MNTPTFGAGKLKDGGTVCTSCHRKIIFTNPNTKLKNSSLEDINNLLQAKLDSDNQYKIRLDEIKHQIQELKLSDAPNFLVRKEINELPAILASAEKVDNLAQGIYNNQQGILVSTDRRLIFIDKGLSHLKVEDFPLDKISSIQYETGLVFGSITIHTSGNAAKIMNIGSASARSFAEFVRGKISQPKEATTTTIVSEPNVLDQLEKLAKLKESGILSEEEFLEQKKKLLEKL